MYGSSFYRDREGPVMDKFIGIHLIRCSADALWCDSHADGERNTNNNYMEQLTFIGC